MFLVSNHRAFRAREARRWLLLLAASAALAGCGYSFRPIAREGVRFIHLPLFENDSRRRELEFPLTEAVARELRSAGYRLSSPNGADARLKGRITEVTEQVQSEDPTGAPAQGRITVKVRFRLLDAEGRKVLAEGEVAEGGEVVFARGEDRPAGLDRAVRELARAVVRGLEPPPP
ncbi:MAG: LPS assembly lipoprotein LptE [Planctomycetota bacterium]|jgi:outer membrane lipopolysaccharide assembly protein LptE/RlpB